MTGGVPGWTRLVARHRRNPLLRRLAGLSRRYLAAWGNLDYDSAHNGEARVLQVLAGFGPTLIVDAGANVGDWSLAAARACPKAQIHAYEISPPTFAQLRAATAGEPRIHCHAVGLSDQPGQLVLRHFGDAPALSTTSDYPHPLPSTEITVDVVRGEDEARRLGLAHIDFLKIDVEGMEERVLLGFDPLLRAGAIDLVQFEYGRVNILNGFLLHRSAAFFRERGYVIGKIYPDHVDFREPALDDEDFLGPNYLACRADRSDLISRLR
jgi:FkbM family methyltransferase